jgi:tRNA threonylcarbamoyladenosine biosynthesis protein TsaE
MAAFSWSSVREIPAIAREFLKTFEGKHVFAFHGEMGTGKTTFIKALCRELGSMDALGSPTFSIVNEYRSGKGDPVYHIDLYRVETLREALDLGLTEYLESGHYCFVEWPQVAAELMPDDAVLLDLIFMPDQTRNLTTRN